MRNVNKKKLFNFLILVSLFYRIRGEFGGIKEQRKIASGPQLKNNFGETPAETVITTAITVDDEKFDDYELRKLFVQKFKWYENLERERNNNVTPEMLPRRKIRDTANETSVQGNLECLSCFTNGTSSSGSNCFTGTHTHFLKCPENSLCVTEINPNHIKRGCAMPNKLIRTFVCKCPLCNDKSSIEPTFYNYNTISDWEYHNQCLQVPALGIDLVCKACTTKGTNTLADALCKSGKTSEFMTCKQNEFCFTHINAGTDFVSRGCTTMPVYNSMFIFCNATKCNNIAHKQLILNQRADVNVMKKMSFRASDEPRNTCLPIQRNIALVLVIITFIYCAS